MCNVSLKDRRRSDKRLEDMFRTGDSTSLVTLREWTRISGKHLRCQVQLVEEGQRKHGKK